MTAGNTDISALEFGVGSFAFETFPAGEDNDNAWEDRVRALLESIPTVRDVQFSNVETFRVARTAMDGNWESDGVLLTPHPWSGSLSFHITIPARIQRELADKMGGGPIFEGRESFFVITYFADFPATYVFVEGEASPNPYGSQAVAIVRRFLDDEVKRYRSDDSIEFSFIGPSPFPCDFLLKPSTESDQMKAPYLLQRTPREGHDEITLTYDSARYNSAFAAMPTVCRRLAGELAYFYECARKRERRIRIIFRLRSETERLMAITIQRGWGRAMVRFFKSRKLIRNLSLDLILADYECREEEQAERDGLDRSAEIFSGLFNRETSNEIKDSRVPEIENLDKIVELISSRQRRGVDITMLLITSLLGGIIGSVLTIIFTSNS